MQYETGLFLKTECLVKVVKKCVLKKLNVWLELIKSGGFSGKLPKKTIYINEFISYLNQLLHNT